MRSRRHILDSTLRDGAQTPGLCLTREQKLKIAALLDAGGARQIEAGVPASSRREKETIARIVENRKNAAISVWGRLVPSDIAHAIDCRPDVIHVSAPVSHTHIHARLGKDEAWVIGRLRVCLGLIGKSGATPSVGLEDAFRGEPRFMEAVADTLLDFGVKRVRISDTVGVALPGAVREVLTRLSSRLGDGAVLGFHAHNDLGMAVANTVEAAKHGCLYADVTAGGIGERAGNCDLARLVAASSDIFDWGMTEAAAFKLQRDILETLRPENAWLPDAVP
ncbi:MAG: homocitrate synthase [Clostridiales Family XIII bacterium]|jgi:homocitrate synthase NifV|nr:homocitrate synthase [Clostridiales Family XIII bacterium]